MVSALVATAAGLMLPGGLASASTRRSAAVKACRTFSGC
jgi:hypothetical protein